MSPEPWNWKERDLLALIELGVQESIELDFKRSEALQRTDAKKNELSKDVSAFANSAGGTLVYGIMEDGHVAIGIDAGLDPSIITKEWLEQVINSRIQRRISDVRINQVLLPLSSPGRVAYVIEIPQSSHAPHQAFDKRFYKRFNFESVPMEEYELRDVMNRASSPELALRFAFRHGDEELLLSPHNEHMFDGIDLSAVLTNLSQRVAEYVVVDLYLDARMVLGPLPKGVQSHRTGATLIMSGVDQKLHRLTTTWDRTKGMPIFAGVEARLPETPLRVRLPRSVDLFALRYTLASPGMKQKDEYRFISIENNVARFIIPQTQSLLNGDDSGEDPGGRMP